VTTLATFFVLAVELDGGMIALADRRVTLGSDVCYPAVQSWGGINTEGTQVTIETLALPEWARDSWWINRQVMILECSAGDDSIYDGEVRFDGVIGAEPDEESGLWSLVLAPPRRRVRMVPDYGIVTATDWPLAADAAMGAHKPLVVGAVDYCPLLPVQVQPWTTLTAPAVPDTRQLEVADASGLAAAGSVVVDGQTYSYTHKADNILMGMSITGRHAAGTLVAQAGSNIYLAAGHAVTGINEIRAGDARLDGGTVDLSAATVTFSSPPKVATGATRYTYTEHFDSTTGSTCANPANAIRAALNTYTQPGTPSGIVTAALPGTIAFSRPADGNRIISGAYTVQFSVAVGAQVGWARVKIGNDVVWSYDPGVGVIFNASPAASTFDDDSDVIPVTVEVAEGGSTDQVSVTIITASRVVVTGNLDEANYALIAPGQKLTVTQTGIIPPLGKIAKAQLVVRWFATDAALGTTAVSFGGRSIGKLALTPNSGASINKTVAVNSVTQGSAVLPQTAISTSATKTDSQTSMAVNFPISYTVAEINTNHYIFLHPLDVNVALPLGVVAGTYTFTLSLNPQGTAGLSAQSTFTIGGQMQTINTETPPATLSFSVPLTAGQRSLNIRHYQLGGKWPADWIAASAHPTVSMVSGNVTTTPTAGVVSVSASSSPISAASLANSGIAVSLTNNQIQLTVPAPPRVVNTVFDLPGYAEWSQFTNQIAEIILTGTGASLAIVETYLNIEFDEIAYAAGENLTATVTGLDGNPASVISLLAAASDEPVDAAALRRLDAWCDANSLAFARRLADQTDALTLMQFAADQAGVMLARTPDGLAPIRWTDMASEIVELADADLLQPASIGWGERIENAITLRYAENYTEGDFTRILQATASNDQRCRDSVAQLLDTRPVVIDGGWLRADAAVSVALEQHAARYARPRRFISLALPFGFSIEAGSLVEYDEAVWRVTSCSSDNGWIDLEAEEVLP
jgi:hypothetical protein